MKSEYDGEGIRTIILTQYVLSIASLLISIIFLIMDSSLLGLARCVTQVLVTLSSNCCSVACTLTFLDRNSEKHSFQSSRTIIIVISLVSNIILSILFQSGIMDHRNFKLSQFFITLAFLGCVIIASVSWLIKLQIDVERTNASIMYTLSNDQMKTIESAHELGVTKIDDINFDFGDSDDAGGKRI